MTDVDVRGNAVLEYFLAIERNIETAGLNVLHRNWPRAGFDNGT